MSFDSVLVAGMGKSGAATVKAIRDRARRSTVGCGTEIPQLSHHS